MPDDPTPTQPNRTEGNVVPVQDSTEVTVETTDSMMGPVIAGRRGGELVACAVEEGDAWHVMLSRPGLPTLVAKTEADALAWVTHLTSNGSAVEAPVVAVTGRDLALLLNLFREIAGRPYVPPVVRVWIDPIDRAVKVKAGSGTWSPPFGEIEVSA
jgi:hypothetical protein